MEAFRQRIEALKSRAAFLLMMQMAFFSWTMPALLGQDAASNAIDAAIEAGNLSQAISNVRKLPLEQRLDWIDPLWQQWQSRSTSSSRSGAPGGSSESDAESAQPMGGAAGADFQSLIQLITSTVEANWEADGGTDTIQEFASGVWIDPQGVMIESVVGPTPSDRQGPSKKVSVQSIAPWLKDSHLRWVSLTALVERQKGAGGFGDQLERAGGDLLGGLARVEWVLWDPQHQQWLLGGPAGGYELDAMGRMRRPEDGMEPFPARLLWDLAPVIDKQTGPFGCSIDPDPQALVQASRLAARPETRQLLARSPDQVRDQLIEALGRQVVSLRQLPDQSMTGLDLLIADRHMKRVGLGLESKPDGMKDYFEWSGHHRRIPAQSLVRWWFTLSPSAIIRSPDGHAFRIPDQSLQVLSDHEFLDATGQRTSSQSEDIAGKSFASDFTKHFRELCRMHRCYGRIQQVFDAALVLEVIRRSPQGANLMDRLVQQHATQLTQPVRFTPTIGAQEAVGKQHVVIVSGGVQVDPSQVRVIPAAADWKEPNRPHFESPASRNAPWFLD
ncbi:MAG: DUF1598 domain-containing protein [Pirellulaceae bacterium]|jgi:hypothetical protein